MLLLAVSVLAAWGQVRGPAIDQAAWQKAVASLREGRSQEALAQFKISLGQNPEPAAVLAAGKLLRQRDALDQAEALYIWAREGLKREDAFALEMGEIHQSQLKYREAVKEYGRSARSQPSKAMEKLEELALQAGYPAVAQLAEKEVDQKTDDGKWLVGEIFRRAGDIPRAWHYHRGIKEEKRLRTCVERLTTGADQDVRTAITIINQYLSQPRSDRTRWEVRLADLYIQILDYQKAQELLSGLSDKGLPQAQLKLARLWLEYGDQPARAREMIRAHRPFWPDSLKLEGEFLACQCLMAAGDWAGAQEKCAQLSEGGYAPEVRQRALFLTGEMMMAENLTDQALKYYGQAARATEEGIYTNDALYKLLLISQAKTDKISILEPLARAMRHRLWGEREKAREAYQVLADSARGMLAGDLALAELAEIELAGGRYQKAAEWLKLLAETSSDSLTAARAYYQTGRIYFYDLEQEKEGRECWKAGILKYPNTAWAEMMRRQLESGGNQ